MARYYVIAGESSGDMHGSNLIRCIKKADRQAAFRFWGGDRMAAEAGKPVKHIKDLAFMGFWEVLVNLKIILRNLRLCKNDLLEFNPDVIILIDYPGFNLRMAKFAKKNGLKVVYYISPQIWAWKQNRVNTIKKTVDKMLVILPFEKDFYKQCGMDVEFVGHPLLDEVLPLKQSNSYENFMVENHLPNKPLVALLPGSRKQEVTRMLKDMTDVASEFPDHQFVVAGVSSLGREFYQKFVQSENVSVVCNQTYALLANAKAALVASGTATLETALFGVPQVVCYKANALSVFIARRLVKIKYISLVNLILNQAALKELIQKDFDQKTLMIELKLLLSDKERRKKMISCYSLLEKKLGGTGASENAAKIVTQLVGVL